MALSKLLELIRGATADEKAAVADMLIDQVLARVAEESVNPSRPTMADEERARLRAELAERQEAFGAAVEASKKAEAAADAEIKTALQKKSQALALMPSSVTLGQWRNPIMARLWETRTPFAEGLAESLRAEAATLVPEVKYFADLRPKDSVFNQNPSLLGGRDPSQISNLASVEIRQRALRFLAERVEGRTRMGDSDAELIEFVESERSKLPALETPDEVKRRLAVHA